jgi:hypothetical protein
MLTSLFLFYVCSGYTVTDWDSLLETAFPAPVGALFQQTTKSLGATVTILLVLTITSIVGNISYISASFKMVHGYASTGARKL